MDWITKDIDIIRAVRRLCLQRDFDQAIRLAGQVDDAKTRETLTFICRSFKQAQINVRAA